MSLLTDKPQQREKTTVAVEDSINEYLDQIDWRVKANANIGYSIGGLILNISGKMVANYWLNHIYPPAIGQAHRKADYHIHDLDMLGGYCAGWSLRTLLNEGFNGVPNKVEAGPPKHMSSAIGQIVNFLGTLQNEWAGAQAFSSFDTYMAPFIRVDKLPYEVVKQNMQELIFNLNVPSRWGSQTPFTNLTFDWTCPEDLRMQHPLIGGKEMPFTYGDLPEEMAQINRAFIEVMTEGDRSGRVFTFPIPTYNISPDFPWDSANADLLFSMTAKYGLPYFQNFVNSELKPNMIRSMCCRLQLDMRELLETRKRSLRFRRTNRLARRRHDQLRETGLSVCGRRKKIDRPARRAFISGERESRNQAKNIAIPSRSRLVSLYKAFLGDVPQSLLHHRRQRNERNGPQFYAG